MAPFRRAAGADPGEGEGRGRQMVAVIVGESWQRPAVVKGARGNRRAKRGEVLGSRVSSALAARAARRPGGEPREPEGAEGAADAGSNRLAGGAARRRGEVRSRWIGACRRGR